MAGGPILPARVRPTSPLPRAAPVAARSTLQFGYPYTQFVGTPGGNLLLIDHLRLSFPEPFGWFAPPKLTRAWEPTLSWNQ